LNSIAQIVLKHAIEISKRHKNHKSKNEEKPLKLK
jgi:hypothetical protein